MQVIDLSLEVGLDPAAYLIEFLFIFALFLLLGFNLALQDLDFAFDIVDVDEEFDCDVANDEEELSEFFFEVRDPLWLSS